MRYVKIIIVAALAFGAASCGSLNGKNNCDCPHWSHHNNTEISSDLAENAE